MSRLVTAITLAFLGFLFGVLLFVSIAYFMPVLRVSAVPERPIARLIESDFREVPTPRSAQAETPQPSAAVPFAGLARPGAPELAGPTAGPGTPSLPAVPPVGLSEPFGNPDTAGGGSQPADRATPPPANSGAASRRLGVASWYPARGFVAAVHSWRWGDDPYNVVLTTISGGRTLSVTVTVSDYCEACVGPRLIDLSDDAFRVLAPLSAGVVRVTLEDLR